VVDAGDVEFTIEGVAVEPRVDLAGIAGILRVGKRWEHDDCGENSHTDHWV